MPGQWRDMTYSSNNVAYWNWLLYNNLIRPLARGLFEEGIHGEVTCGFEAILSQQNSAKRSDRASKPMKSRSCSNNAMHRYGRADVMLRPLLWRLPVAVPSQCLHFAEYRYFTSCATWNVQVPPRPTVREEDIEEKFLCGSGPGGQKIVCASPCWL